MSRRLERDRSERCDRWQQVQGGQHPTQELPREKVERRRAQLEKRVAPYLMQLDTADLQEPSEEVGLLETRAIQPPIAKRISFDEVAHPALGAGKRA